MSVGSAGNIEMKTVFDAHSVAGGQAHKQLVPIKSTQGSRLALWKTLRSDSLFSSEWIQGRLPGGSVSRLGFKGRGRKGRKWEFWVESVLRVLISLS